MLYCSMSTRVIVVEDATLKNGAKVKFGVASFCVGGSRRTRARRWEIEIGGGLLERRSPELNDLHARSHVAESEEARYKTRKR